VIVEIIKELAYVKALPNAPYNYLYKKYSLNMLNSRGKKPLLFFTYYSLGGLAKAFS